MSIQSWHSFEFCAYPPELGADDAVIVISHRGTKTYSYLALEMAKASGAYTVSITSTDPGPRIQVSDVVINTVEPERSAAFTISYTSAMTVLALLANAIGSWSDSSRPVSAGQSQAGRRPPALRPVAISDQVSAVSGQRSAVSVDVPRV